MEPNTMPGGMYSNVQTGVVGLEMSLHHHIPPQNPPNPHHAAQQQSHPNHPMVAYGHQERDYHPQTQQYAKQGHSFSAKSKNQSLTTSDDDEPGFTAENSADDGKRRMSSPWQRMKWTDNMVRLLIMVVFYIGDEVGSEGTNPASKKKGGGVLQKKGKWKSVSRAMMERGFYVSPQQCEDKFNDLNKRYKRVNDILGKGTSCRVVENPGLLDTMDHLSPKMKEEVKKLLNSKHLFYREMCAYHNSCGHGGGASASGTGGVQHSPSEAAAEPSQAQQQRCLHSTENAPIMSNLNIRRENEGSKLAKGTVSEDDDDEDDEDEDEEDDSDEEDGDEVTGGGSRFHDDMNEDGRSSRKMGVPDMDEPSFSDSELDYHVRNALKAAVQGDCDFYNQLVAVIHHRERLVAEEVALLVTCLKAVTGAVSCIDIVHHRSLLAAIFGMSLWNYGTDVMDALIELLVSLASSSGEFVDLCLEMLVVNFMPPSAPPSAAYFVEFLNQPRGLAKKTQVLDRIHSTLKDIAKVVPLSPLRLQKIVRDKMPNIYTKEPYIVMYVENMLRLESGAMGELLGSTILVALIDRLIDLDVEIAWDDILQDDFHKGIFDMELENLEGHADHIEQNCNELTREAVVQRFFNGNLVAEKLDSLMVLTFKHLESCYESGRLVLVFETLLQSFQKTILTAYKSKFAQFVLYYACSLDPENCGKMFVNMLMNIFVSSLNTEWRMSAVAYLASYLARAKFVSVSLVAAVLESVVNWCFLYCKSQDGDINPKAHKVFYAGCQAIMYVLCFRMRQMLAVPRLKSQLLLMRIEDVLGHPLKPLQVCLPSIVEEFLRLVKVNRVFSLPQSFADQGLLESEHSRAFGGPDRFDTFFPFDPCLLRKCDGFIRPNYVYWSMVRSTYDEDEEGTSEDEDVGEAYTGREGLNIPDDGSGRSYDEDYSDADEFDYSLDKMSITPKDSTIKSGGRIQRFVQMPSKIRPSTSPESL